MAWFSVMNSLAVCSDICTIRVACQRAGVPRTALAGMLSLQSGSDPVVWSHPLMSPPWFTYPHQGNFRPERTGVECHRACDPLPGSTPREICFCGSVSARPAVFIASVRLSLWTAGGIKAGDPWPRDYVDSSLF